MRTGQAKTLACSKAATSRGGELVFPLCMRVVYYGGSRCCFGCRRGHLYTSRHDLHCLLVSRPMPKRRRRIHSATSKATIATIAMPTKTTTETRAQTMNDGTNITHKQYKNLPLHTTAAVVSCSIFWMPLFCGGTLGVKSAGHVFCRIHVRR